MRALIPISVLSLCSCFNPSGGGDEGTSSSTATIGPTESGGASTRGAATPQDTGTPTTSAQTSSPTETGMVDDTSGATDATSTDGSSTSGNDDASSSTGAVAPERVVMFSSAPVTGNILERGMLASIRAGADSLCEDALASHPAVECTNTHAVLSINANDEVRDMPSNYSVPDDLPVEGPTGILVDDNFDALLDGSLMSSPLDAGVIPAAGNIWSGSNNMGEILNTTCSGWTVTQGMGAGGFGSAGDGTSNMSWLGAISASCAMELPLLCVCW